MNTDSRWNSGKMRMRNGVRLFYLSIAVLIVGCNSTTDTDTKTRALKEEDNNLTSPFSTEDGQSSESDTNMTEDLETQVPLPNEGIQGEWKQFAYELRDGVLTLTGNGRMEFDSYDDCPWLDSYQYTRGDIKKIIIGQGITELVSHRGNSAAMFGKGSVEEIVIPDLIERVIKPGHWVGATTQVGYLALTL